MCKPWKVYRGLGNRAKQRPQPIMRAQVSAAEQIAEARRCDIWAEMDRT